VAIRADGGQDDRERVRCQMAKPKQAIPDVCKLTLTIRGVDYRVTPHPCTTGRAWKLRRADGKGSCIVAEGSDGASCDCPDARFRHATDNEGCKHIRACRALSLIA
jgi:hypothetical protein